MENMTFSEILFHSRWHVIGGAILMVFVVAFLREVVRELKLERQLRTQPRQGIAFGPLVQDPMLGAVMTDGGEPLEEENDEDGEKR